MRELAAGSPILHEQAVITLWATLEALVRDFLAAWIANRPEARTLEKIRSLRVSVGEYDDLAAEDRPLFILELLEEALKCRRRGGVDRFEPVFDLFDVTSPIDSSVRKTLFEMSHIRHVLVHRRGIADRRFVDACAWLGHKAGDTIRVNHDSYHAYLDAASLYTFAIIQRVRAKYGLSPAEHKDACRFSKVYKRGL